MRNTSRTIFFVAAAVIGTGEVALAGELAVRVGRPIEDVGWIEGERSFEILGDPTRALVVGRYTDKALLRWRNTKVETFEAEKTKREALAARGFATTEVLEVGTWRGAAAMIVRQYPGARVVRPEMHGYLDTRVNPPVTLRDLGTIEATIASLRSRSFDVSLRSLLVTHDGHVLVNQGAVWQEVDSKGLPLPIATAKHRSLDSNTRMIDLVRNDALFLEGLLKDEVFFDLSTARAFAADLHGVGPQGRSRRAVTARDVETVQRLLRYSYGVDLHDRPRDRDEAIEADLRHAAHVRTVLERHGSGTFPLPRPAATTAGRPATPSKGLAGCVETTTTTPTTRRDR